MLISGGVLTGEEGEEECKEAIILKRVGRGKLETSQAVNLPEYILPMVSYG